MPLNWNGLENKILGIFKFIHYDNIHLDTIQEIKLFRECFLSSSVNHDIIRKDKDHVNSGAKGRPQDDKDTYFS